VLKTAIKIGPKDNGKRMSLADFDHAEVQEGYLYELGRGIIVVSDVPGLWHLVQLLTVRAQLMAYDLAHPGRIFACTGGAESKVLVWPSESERHPDLSVYLTRPPRGGDPWSTWIPDLVIEIVSASSWRRDYEEKPDEYHTFGVREYWIIDAQEQQVTVLRRWGRRWRRSIVGPPDVCRTRLLPGFELDCAAVFAAADAIEE
jgi:Uma2 family endonuclease